MKITKRQLRRIIREEKQRLLESQDRWSPVTYDNSMKGATVRIWRTGREGVIVSRQPDGRGTLEFKVRFPGVGGLGVDDELVWVHEDKLEVKER